MKELLKKYSSRKFLLAVAGIVVVLVNPQLSAKTLCAILGLPSLFIVMESIKETFKKELPK